MTVRRLLTVVVFLYTFALSQNPPVSKAPNTSVTEKTLSKEIAAAQRWLEQAKLLTAEVEQDGAQLNTNDAAVSVAQLSRLWWRVEPPRSRQLLDRAIEQVTRIPDNETQEERQNRVRAGFMVVQIATPMISSEEAKRISSELARDLSDPRENAMAKMRQRQAFKSAVSSEIGHGNVAHAAEMMLQGLKDGNSLPDLSMLRWHDPAAADRVFRAALKALPELNYDPGTLVALVRDAFPAVEGTQSAPDELKNALLQTVAEAVLHAPRDENDKNHICMNVQSVMMFMSGAFPPPQWSAMQAVVDDCLPRKGNEPPASAGFKSPQECFKVGAQQCLRLADQEQDPIERKILRFNAISAALAEKNPELALSIYKNLTDEERSSEPDLLINLEDAYHQLGQKFLKNNDRPGFLATLREAPDELRPSLQLTFAEEMLEKGPNPDGLALLAEARAAAKNGIHTLGLYLNLLDLYIRFLPEDASAVTTQVIEGINRVSYPKDELEAMRTRRSLGVRVWQFSVKILNLDPSFLSVSADSIQTPQYRASFRLGLLRCALLQYVRALAAAEKATEQKPGTEK